MYVYNFTLSVCNFLFSRQNYTVIILYKSSLDRTSLYYLEQIDHTWHTLTLDGYLHVYIIISRKEKIHFVMNEIKKENGMWRNKFVTNGASGK